MSYLVMVGSYYYRWRTLRCIFDLKRMACKLIPFTPTSIMVGCSLYQQFSLTSRQRKIKRAFFHESLLEGTMNVMDDDDQETLIVVAPLVGVLGDKR